MTLTPFLATDSPVFLYVVIIHPVSGCVLTDITSAVRGEKEGAGGRAGGREGGRDGENGI